MNESNRLSDTQATVILTALAVLMLGAIWWGLSNPASTKATDKFEVIVVTEATVTTNLIPPEALVGPNERVELDMSDFDFTIGVARTDKGPIDASSVNLADFEMRNYGTETSPATLPPAAKKARPKPETSSEDTTETEGK